MREGGEGYASAAIAAGSIIFSANAVTFHKLSQASNNTNNYNNKNYVQQQQHRQLQQ